MKKIARFSLAMCALVALVNFASCKNSSSSDGQSGHKNKNVIDVTEPTSNIADKLIDCIAGEWRTKVYKVEFSFPTNPDKTCWNKFQDVYKFTKTSEESTITVGGETIFGFSVTVDGIMYLEDTNVDESDVVGDDNKANYRETMQTGIYWQGTTTLFVPKDGNKLYKQNGLNEVWKTFDGKVLKNEGGDDDILIKVK